MVYSNSEFVTCPLPLSSIKKFVNHKNKTLYLTLWDLALLSENYIQKGLLFTKPLAANAQEDFIKSLLDKLKQSLSEALVRFYPLSGRLVTQKNEFISRVEAQKFRRMFQFSSQSIAKLKEKSNAETNTNKISFFQTLSALVWRCITRARCLPHDQITSCRLATDNRSRMEPSLSNDYFGNSLYAVGGVTTAGELLEHNLGWAAWKLHEAVANHSDKVVRDFFDIWLQSPFVLQPARIFDPYSVMMGSSPRFNMYGNEFGMGEAVALRSVRANKFDGKVSSYPGNEGSGSIDLEVCLSPDSMSALESDKEFMDAVSLSYKLH